MLRVPGSLGLLAFGLVLCLWTMPALAQNGDAEKECREAFSKGRTLYDMGKYREALPYYEKALELAPRAFGENSPNTAIIVSNLANLYKNMGQYAKAEPLYERSREINEARLGKDHPDVADSLNDLAILYKAMGQYAKAEPLYLRSLEIREAKLGKNHSDVADTLNNLANLYSATGQYAKAQPLYQRALEIKEAKLGKYHPDVASSLNNLANLYSDMGQYAKAEQLHRRGLEIREAKLGKDHPAVADSLNNLANLYNGMGEYAKAEPLHQRSLQIREAKLGKDHPAVADSLNNLANLYAVMGQYARAEPLFRRNLEICEAKLGKDHPDVASSLNNLANLYKDMGQYAKAEPLYQRSLEIREAKLGTDHPAVASCLNNLANLYKATGQYAKAEPHYRRSLEIREAKLGKDHPAVADSLNNVGVLYADMGRYAKAEPLYQRSLEIREAMLGKDHPDVADTLNNLALLYAAQDQWNDAARVTTRLRRLVRTHVRRTLPVLSDREQLDFLQNTDEKHFHVSLSLGLERCADPAFAAASAAWLVNGKAIAQESLSERARMALASTDSQTGKVASQLTSVRQQLAALTLAASKSGQEAARLGQIAALTDQEQKLARKLGQLLGQPSRTDPWMTLDEVRKALPDGAILIEIGRFHVPDFKAKGGEAWWKGFRYAAWLITPAGQGEVHLIDLGDADKIDGAVAAVRKGVLAAQGTATQKSVIIEKGEPDAEKELQPALATLAKLVLEPLRKHIDSRNQWLLSPDGALWLVPWEALPLDDQTYVIEKHTLRYLVSGRDLVTPAFRGKVKSDGSVIMADPDFDIDPKEATVLTAKLLGKQRPTNDEPLVALDNPQGTRSASVIGRVGRLPGTAAEAAAIKPKLHAYASEAPWVYRGKNALEGVFKSFHSPKVVVLSTHGFFLEDQEFKGDDRADLTGSKQPLRTKDGRLPENPLLRCGLLLAGCNQAAQAKPGQDDGVLTGLEIVGCDLRGTELVVLSACETGLGQVRNGEGVAGLRQAFQLAGAQAVVASLWQVSDKDTALLMSDFFDGLAKGKGKAEALREAQLARIKAHRDRDGAAHPFFWAAFTVTGK